MRKIIFIVLLSITGGYIKSQNVGISSGGSTPRDCAMLDILSSNTGLLIPNLALTANNVYLPAIGTAVDGLLIYNTATAGGITSTAVLPGYYYWSTSASKWVALSGNGSKDWGLLGNAGITQPATPATYGTSTLGAAENWMGTTDGNDVVFGTNDIERMRLFSSGQLSIGSSLVGAKLNVHQTTATAVGRFTTYGNTNDIELRRAQGTQAAPTATSGTGTVLGRLFAQGYDGATYTSAASISMETDAAGGTSTDMPGRIVFNTTLDGTGTPLVERMRIINSGQVGINMTPTMQLDVTSSSTTASDVTIRGASTGNALVYGVQGSVTSTTNFASGVFGLASGTSGNIYGVLGQAYSTTANSAGVRGYGGGASGATFGVWGENNSTAGTGVYGIATQATTNGNGVWGSVNSSTGGATGVYGTSSNAAGLTYGVLGQNSSTAGYGVYGTAPWRGVYGNQTNTATAGTGYTYGLTYSGVVGYNSVAGTAVANGYHFGVHGSANNGAAGTTSRIGGVLGNRETGEWGSLGYLAANLTNYAGYFSAAILNGGTGRMSNANTLQKSSIGIGVYGDLMAGWARGNVYGMNLKGERYSLYVDGKQYTNDVITQISNNGNGERNVTYASTSTSVDVYSRGSGKLENGKTTISFGTNYSIQLSAKEKVMVTITPTGPSNGVYAIEISNKGFTVIENNNGTSNVEFSWIAVGVRKGYENPEHPKEILSSDYDEKMKGVMFNENDLQNSGTPVWWDGTQLRFDKAPASQNVKEKQETGSDDPKFSKEQRSIPSNDTIQKQNPK